MRNARYTTREWGSSDVEASLGLGLVGRGGVAGVVADLHQPDLGSLGALFHLNATPLPVQPRRLGVLPLSNEMPDWTASGISGSYFKHQMQLPEGRSFPCLFPLLSSEALNCRFAPRYLRTSRVLDRTQDTKYRFSKSTVCLVDAPYPSKEVVRMGTSRGTWPSCPDHLPIRVQDA